MDGKACRLIEAWLSVVADAQVAEDLVVAGQQDAAVLETDAVAGRARSVSFRREGSQELMAGRMLAEKMLMLISETRQYDNYHREILPAFDDNLQANLLAYRNDTGDFFVLLDAWEMLLMKKIEMYDKLFNVLKLEAEYEYELESR